MVRSIVENPREHNAMANSLKNLVPATRIRASTEVIVRPPEMTVSNLMHQYSANSDVVFLGLMNPKRGEEAEYAAKVDKLARGFRTTIFVHNATEFAGHLI
jgi:hypothetical protein